MRGHAARDVDADGGDFGFVRFVVVRRRASLSLGDESGRLARSTPSSQIRDPSRLLLGRGPACGNAEIRAGANQDFFEPADIFDDAQRLAFAVGRWQIRADRRWDIRPLARTVKCDIAAAIAFEHFHAALGQYFRRGNHVCSFCVAAESDDRRVLEQKEHIADASSLRRSTSFCCRRRPVA